MCEGARVGNFVEMKKSSWAQVKANHLTYLGDASVGAGANSAQAPSPATMTASPRATEIGPGAFIGSNSALVAPVTVGENAIVGAGSVITKNVPADAVAIARGSQSNIDGAAERFQTEGNVVMGQMLPSRA